MGRVFFVQDTKRPQALIIQLSLRFRVIVVPIYWRVLDSPFRQTGGGATAFWRVVDVRQGTGERGEGGGVGVLYERMCAVRLSTEVWREN